MSCKGICSRYKAAGYGGKSPRYINGQKRCQICQMYIRYEGLWCPCCRHRLRTKPRSTEFKRKFEVRANLR